MKSDIEIIRAIANREERALSALYELYAERIYNTALSYTKKEVDAEEVTQDVFMKIYKNATNFRGKSTVSTWIYRIAINTSLNYLKKKNRFIFFKKNFIGSPTITFEHPGVLLENKENAATLYQVMDDLPDNQKTAFILSYVEELPRQEVADIMDTSLKAVESLLQRAKKNMRLTLEEMYPHRRKSKK